VRKLYAKIPFSFLQRGLTIQLFQNLKRRYINLFLIFFIAVPTIYAQEDSIKENKNIFHVVREDVASFYRTGINVFTSPLSFSKKEWIVSGCVISATAVTFLVDDKCRSFWGRNQSKSLSKISDVGYFYGNIENVVLIAASIYFGGLLFDESDIRETGRSLLEALFCAGLTTTIVKTVFGRSRPYANDGPYQFKAFQFDSPHTSFPSGHITVAFTISSVLASNIDNCYASIILYTLAGSTFMQRTYSDKHWLSDSILAAAIGYYIGKSVVASDNQNEMLNKMAVHPILSSTGLGLELQYLF
jgi:membrane-associated phospholipid phosphatase